MICPESLSTPSIAENYDSAGVDTTMSLNCSNLASKSHSDVMVYTNPTLQSTTFTSETNLNPQTFSVDESMQVASMNEVNSSSNNHSVHISFDQVEIHEGIKDNLGTSSIDAVMTSFVRGHDNVSSNRRLIPQAALKMLDDDSLGLDMTQIITNDGMEQSPTDVHQSFDASSNVHFKLVEDLENMQTEQNNFRHGENLDQTVINCDNESCNVIWTCAFCSLSFESQDLIRRHQDTECKRIEKCLTNRQCTSSSQIDNTQNHEIDSWSTLTTTCSNVINTNNESVDYSSEWIICWKCIICNKEYDEANELSQHFLEHNKQDLALALIKQTLPQYKSKKVKQVHEDPSVKNDDKKSSKNENVELQKYDSKYSNDNGNNNNNTNQTFSIENNEYNKDLKKLLLCSQTSTSGQVVSSQTKSKVDKNEVEPKAKKLKRKVTKENKDGSENAIPGSRDPHTCHICNKVLCSRGNLSKHMILHNTHKPWVCEVCGVGFNTKRDFKHHYMLKHTYERPFVCELCGKSYVSKRDLTVHKTFHKPASFSCDVCGKIFKSAKCVKRHKKRHTKSEQFSCILCFKSFNVKGDLSSHFRKVHKLEKKNPKTVQKNDKVFVVSGLELQNNSQVDGYSQRIIEQTPIAPKEKEVTEYIPLENESSHMLPQQLLTSCLEPSNTKTPVEPKDSLVLNKNFFTVSIIIPISEGSEEKSCPYGVSLSNSENEAMTRQLTEPGAYVMINNSDPDNQSTPQDMLYTTAPIHQVSLTVFSLCLFFCRSFFISHISLVIPIMK